MSKTLRWSEKWFQRGLWLVALVFAGFLIGLGGTIVNDLPKVERPSRLEDHMDSAASRQAQLQEQQAKTEAEAATEALAQAHLRLKASAAEVDSARQSFARWTATRRATESPEHDAELIARTRALDELQAREHRARAEVQAQQQRLLNAEQAGERARRQLQAMQREATAAYERARRAQELRVFGYRLALTLPLLLLAGWLFKRQRHGRWWPFVWGFIFFALFAFFVELVPYLPSYGGYVRYMVGIAITVLVGRWAIIGLQAYLERQRAAEAQGERQRREALAYDTALTRMANKLCPGCERTVDLDNPALDFCPHCGMGLFQRCGPCGTRKNAFSPFCHACGAPAHAQPERGALHPARSLGGELGGEGGQPSLV